MCILFSLKNLSKIKKSTYYSAAGWCLILLTLLCHFDGFGQSTDIFRFEYLNVPENDTGIKTQRYKMLFNLPFKLNVKKDYLLTGMEYNRFDIGYSQEFPFDKSELIRFHVVDLNLGLITKWNENWNLVTIVTPRMASNFVTGSISDDFFLNATATFWKESPKVEKPFRIVLGLTYNNTAGVRFPLPIISYYRRFHPKWSYTLGVPKSDFKHYIGKKHTLEMAVFWDGYLMNVQNNIVLPDDQIASKISWSVLVGSIIYQYNLSERMALFASVGRSLDQEGKLRRDDNKGVYLLNDESNLYIRTGFKIGIF